MNRTAAMPRGWKVWTIGIAFWTVVGLLNFGYQYLDVVTRDRSEAFYVTLIEELTGSYATGILAIGILWLAQTMQRRGIRVFRLVSIHTAIAPVYSVAHTTILWGSRVLVWSVLGLGEYDYGRMPVRYLMELGNDLLDYFILASLIHLVLAYRASQHRALRVAELERELTQARLEALEGQLRPHFLFNALNTVSSVMYRDVAAADRVLAQLGDLLRSSLKSDQSHDVTLAEEIETLEMYLDIMRARFGDRLIVDVTVDPAVKRARVPYLLLQPLVENALEHGDPGDETPARVSIRANRREDSVVLTIQDNGNGAPQGSVEFGVGLRNTSARLAHLYPDRHNLAIRSTERGLTVEVTVPFST